MVTESDAPETSTPPTAALPIDSVGSCGTGSVPVCVIGTFRTPSGVPKPSCVAMVYGTCRLEKIDASASASSTNLNDTGNVSCPTPLAGTCSGLFALPCTNGWLSTVSW